MHPGCRLSKMEKDIQESAELCKKLEKVRHPAALRDTEDTSLPCEATILPPLLASFGRKIYMCSPCVTQRCCMFHCHETPSVSLSCLADAAHVYPVAICVVSRKCQPTCPHKPRCAVCRNFPG